MKMTAEFSMKPLAPLSIPNSHSHLLLGFQLDACLSFRISHET